MTAVHWAELRPDELFRRLGERPIAYLPMGLCEPHGPVAALGLDLFKAEWLCTKAAERAGGVVAPSQTYQIHESGFHARWLHDVVGESAGGLLSLPPHVVCLTFLYQLRALANAGVRAVVAVTGHVGGSEDDIARWGSAFERAVGLTVHVTDDVRLSGRPGDHAGRYELSALMYIRPDLVDLSLLDGDEGRGRTGRLALGATAAEASPEYGEEIMTAALEHLVAAVGELRVPDRSCEPVGHETVEAIYAETIADIGRWTSSRPRPDQQPVPPSSRWADLEVLRIPVRAGDSGAFPDTSAEFPT